MSSGAILGKMPLTRPLALAGCLVVLAVSLGWASPAVGGKKEPSPNPGPGGGPTTGTPVSDGPDAPNSSPGTGTSKSGADNPSGGGSHGGGSGPGGPGFLQSAARNTGQSTALPGQLETVLAPAGGDQGSDSPGVAAAGAVTINTEKTPLFARSGGVSGGGKNSFAGHLQAAHTRFRMKDYRGAIAEANQALALDPKSAAAYARLGAAYNQLKDYSAAEKALVEAIKLDPKNALAWQNKAWALLKQRRAKEALEAAEKAGWLKPNVGATNALKAFSKAMLGDRAGALEDLRVAAALDPRFQARYDKAQQGGDIYNPDDELGLLADSMTAGDGKASASAPWYGGLGIVLILGLWAGVKLGRRAGAVEAAAAEPGLPLRNDPPS